MTGIPRDELLAVMGYLLIMVPRDATVVRNQVGNLSILDADGAYIGYVDFGPGVDPQERVVLLGR